VVVLQHRERVRRHGDLLELSGGWSIAASPGTSRSKRRRGGFHQSGDRSGNLPEKETTVRVIIDTDPGIDDAQAIVFALACGKLEIEAICTVFGNCAVDDGTRNALHLLDLTGRLDIPVFRGAADPLVGRRRPKAAGPSPHGRKGTGAIALPEPRPGVNAAPGHAAAELARRVASAPGEITVLALGPLTNVALAMQLERAFVDAVARIVWMGGIVEGPGHVVPLATTNVVNDPEAAAVVLAETGGKLTMVSLDVTRRVRIDEDRYARIGTYGAVGRYLHAIAASYRGVHDLLVVVQSIRSDLFSVESLRVRLELSDDSTARMADIGVCTWADGRAVLDLYEEALRRSRPPA
jgi:inosine-uridine nucleoside N-ribohydrolase